MTIEQHVEYILLAEFNVDKGATVQHQYPRDTGTEDHILSELMLPDGAHLRTEDWTIFCLNQMTPEKPLLYVLNLVRTKHDSTAKRGVRVKAMAICTKHQYLHIYKPVLLLAMEKYFDNPHLDTLESLYAAVNSMDLSSMPQFTWHEKQILRATDATNMFEEMFMIPHQRRGTLIDLTSGHVSQKVLAKDTHFYDSKIDYDGVKLPIKIPLTINPEEVGDFSIIKLITTFSSYASPNPHHPHLDSCGPTTHPIMLLLNALLTQKRIIFLGHGHPSGQVANYVLAACALGSGCGTVLRGFTERAFPYTNLSTVDELLKCPGFIAGVTNPTYKDHTDWWDVLCDIDTGKITVSCKAPTKQLQQSITDNEFINDVMKCIQAHYGEMAVRAKFQEYVLRFVRLAARYEEVNYGLTGLCWKSDKNTLGYGPVFVDQATEQRELEVYANRIEAWRQTISYKYYQEDFYRWLQDSYIKHLDVHRQLSKLRKLKHVPESKVIAIYEAFLSHIVTHRQIIEFLSFLPQHQGGLSVLGLGLFHSNPKIRLLTIKLFKRLERHPVGYKFIQNLSRFQRIAYERQAATTTI